MKFIYKIVATIISVPLVIVGGVMLGLLYVIYLPCDLVVSIICDIWGA